MKCTWNSKKTGKCEAAATKGQRDTNGNLWAQLCDEHDAKLNEAIESGDPRRIMSSYVVAQGGAEAAARRMI